jgi:hypothetical protein
MWIIIWINPQTIQAQCPVCGTIGLPMNIFWYRAHRANRMMGCPVCYNYFLAPFV